LPALQPSHNGYFSPFLHTSVFCFISSTMSLIIATQGKTYLSSFTILFSVLLPMCLIFYITFFSMQSYIVYTGNSMKDEDSALALYSTILQEVADR